MKGVYNPVEVKINMKRVQNGDNVYFIGNCDMEVSLLDTVIKFYPPKDGERYGVVVINNHKERPVPLSPETSKGGNDEDNEPA